MDAHISVIPFSTSTARATPRRTRALSPDTVAWPPVVADALPLAAASPATGPEDEFEPRERSELVSRVFNCAVALLLFVIVAPLMVVVAVLVRLTSRGPVLYTQTRVGIDRRWNRTRALNERRREDLGGVPFTIYKFRSMRVDAEINGQAVWAAEDDTRVTPIGAIMRKTRIDELPQLFNVIRGDMNMVGPRPERPSIFVRLREQIDEYPARQRVRPGITGLAQVSNPYDSCLDDVRAKVTFDLEYMSRQSVSEDIRILAKTIPVMLFRIGSR